MRTIKDHQRRLKVAEQRINVLSSQLTAMANAGITAAQWNALATITASQLTLLGTDNQQFIAGLQQLPNQSDSNTTLPGVLTWANNLTDNLIASGYMKPS